MKKILCNKENCVAIVLFITTTFFLTLFLSSYFIVGKNFGFNYSNLIVLPLVIILYIITSYYSLKKYIRKYGHYFYIENNIVIYENIQISLLLVKEIIFRGGFSVPEALNFYLINDNDQMIYMSLKTVKKIQKEYNLDIKYDINGFKKEMKNGFNDLCKIIINFIKKNYLRIILAIVGLLVTIGSFILTNIYNKNIFLIISLSIVCIILGIVQLYFFYITDDKADKFTRLFISIFGSCFMIFLLSIFFVATSRGLLHEEPSFYCLAYAIYLYPSFVTIIILIFIMIAILSYS